MCFASVLRVGDRWSLLIVRELMLLGRRTCREFLAGGECIATNVLADRLARLEQLGILERARDPSDGRRALWKLTEKGKDLAPALLELVLWASRHEETAAPAALLDEMKHRRRSFLARLRRQWAEMK